jgi:pilus assembly protein CpaD
MSCKVSPTPPLSMRRIASRTALIAGIAAVLGGCQAMTSRHTGPTYASDYRERHPIVIKEGERTVELFIGKARGGLIPAQRADIGAFAQTWASEASGGIVIEVPTGTPNARAAHDATVEVRSLLAAAGVPPQSVSVRPYQPQSPARLATIRLNYPRMAAAAGPCGLWPQDLGASWGRHYAENQQFYNFGCAHQRNLAAIVENPADLVQPRGESPTYTARRSIVLDKFRKGESTATTYPSQNAGKISTVGQ